MPIKIKSLNKLDAVAVIAVACLMLVCQMAYSQVYQKDSGRNLEVVMSTGPWNSNTITRPDEVPGSLYVTGQVTGGFSFRGNAPYYGANQLRLSLPSKTIDNFTRDSMGINTVMGGVSYKPQAYFSSSSTSFMLGTNPTDQNNSAYVSRGAYVSDRQTTVADPYSIRNDRSMDAYSSTLSSRTMAGLMTDIDTTPASETFAGAFGSATGDVASGAYRVPLNPLFGYMDAKQQERLGVELFDSPDPSAKAADVEIYAATAKGDVSSTLVDILQQADEDALSPASSQTQSQPKGDLHGLGYGDMFNGVLMAVRSQDEADMERSLRNASGSVAAATGDTAARRIESAVLDRLGGRRGDRFNRLMAAGDDLMRDGQYYQAAMRYQVAGRVGEYNPLAPLGEALAYLAAGESYRAGTCLERAIEMYPNLLRIKVDMDTIIGPELAGKRLAEMRQRLDVENAVIEEVPLILMLAFGELNIGQVEQAGRWADVISTMPKASDAARTFASALHNLAPATPAPPATPPASPSRPVLYRGAGLD